MLLLSCRVDVLINCTHVLLFSFNKENQALASKVEGWENNLALSNCMVFPKDCLNSVSFEEVSSCLWVVDHDVLASQVFPALPEQEIDYSDSLF